MNKLLIILIFLLIGTNLAVAQDAPKFILDNQTQNSTTSTNIDKPLIWEKMTPTPSSTILEPTIEISGLQTIIILIVIIIIFLILLIELIIRKMNRPK